MLKETFIKRVSKSEALKLCLTQMYIIQAKHRLFDWYIIIKVDVLKCLKCFNNILILNNMNGQLFYEIHVINK